MARLKCNYCDHVWDANPAPDAVLVCPQCGKKLSLAIVSRLGGSPAPSPVLDASPTMTAIEPKLDEVESTRVGSKLPPSSSPPASAPSHPNNPGERGAMRKTPQASSKPASTHSQKVELSGGQSSAPRKKSHAHKMEHLIGRTIDGYRVEKILGAGGMGAVFLAHQISLDRKIALKVLPASFASNPAFLARFTREALSAAQISHHNLIQVHDVGNDAEVHYIAMEFVPGQSLGDMIKKDGRLQPDAAAGFVLQTARGLKYAHDHGLVHRDIKPDNLMINDQGIIKIADMGLAKMRGVSDPQLRLPPPEAPAPEMPIPSQTGGSQITRDANLTQASVAMGTPAYMAPEQARDAGSVDARADQYSLGCTLYYLIAGATPYQGATAFELISKHLNEQFTPIDVHVKGVPPSLRVVIERMLEKDPGDRYPDMSGVVHELEAYLGIDSEKGPYTPREHHLATLDTALETYYSASAIKLRHFAINGFFGGMGAVFLLCLFARCFALAGGVLGLIFLTPIANFVIEGLRTRNDLFRRVRSVFFGMPAMSWIKLSACVILGVAALAVAGWLVYWIAFAVLAAALAAVYQAGVVRKLKAERTAPVDEVNVMLRELRLRGLGEDALHDFICRFSKENWEEFFEEFFGYEAMLLARGKWAAADQTVKRRKFAVWRDPVARWLDSVEEARRASRERKQLARVEKRVLEAKGISEGEAEKQAQVEATRIMENNLRQVKQAQAAVGELQTGATKSLRRARRGLWFGLVRGLLGLIALAAFIHMRGIFEIPVAGALLAKLGEFGFAGNILGAVAGGALILSTFSRWLFASVLTLVGAATVWFANPIADTPVIGVLGPAVIAVIGAGLCVLGVGGPLLARLFGRKF